MKIKTILENFPELQILVGSREEEVSYIWADSRKIQVSDIFLVSTAIEDLKYLKDAASKGAKVLILTKDSNLIDSAKHEFPTIILSSEPAEQIQGKIASFLLGNPSLSLKVIAVTGTNGKTSMTHILDHFASTLGYRTGLIGTLHARFGNQIIETGYTTPDSSTLQWVLSEMVKDGIEFVFIEASSHGLKLGRTAGLDIYGAIFTNLTKDHMDFHPTIEDYLYSKFRLFLLLKESKKEGKFGIVYTDASGGKEMEDLIRRHELTDIVSFVGSNQSFEFLTPKLSINGSEFRFLAYKKESSFTRTLLIKTNLLGGFNTVNLSLAIAAWMQVGLQVEKIPFLCEFIPRIPGRFDVYSDGDGSRVAVVDYAHTPDALLNILTSCKEMNPKQLVCVFGCGGDRDRTKRPEMAKIAEENSDFVIITSDNPRTEDPEFILDEIQSGFSPGFTNYLRIEDRRAAIAKGIEILESGGIIAICGKGHENYQIIGREKTYFDDGEEVEKSFQKRETSRH
jgi:UDP-N-acetylmuramoyl-L-alanyl-D-glutamate--2,6-diaminopimelate ligase